MEGRPDLRGLYARAREALAAGDRDGAREVLKQVVLADEDYEDASRLLADLVAQKRLRGYSRRLTWAAVSIMAVIGLAALFWKPLWAAIRPAASTPLSSLAVTHAPTEPSAALLPSPTAIPLKWSRLYHGSLFARDTVTAIVVDPEDPDVMYAGLEHAAIYKSVDGGISWAPAHAGLGAAHILCLTIDPQAPRTLYACVSGAGVFKTIDGGSSWQAINTGLTQALWNWWAGDVEVDPLDSSHMLYAAISQLYESRDAGGTWSTLWSQESKEAPYTAIAVALRPGDSRTVFVVGDAGGDSTRGGVYVSTDGGQTWSLSGESGRLTHLAMDATGQCLYASNDHVVGSSNGGRTWRELIKDTPCASLTVQPDEGATLICGTPDGQLLATTDAGSSWTRLGKLDWGKVGSVAFLPGPGSSLLVGARGVYLSTDGGLNWAERLNGLGAGRLDLALNPGNRAVLYAVESSEAGQTTDTAAFRSLDDGPNWTTIANVGQGLALDADGRTLYRFHPAPGEVMRSQDGGATWTSLPAPQWIGSLAADPNQPGGLLLYAWNTPNVYRSTDQGASWHPASGVEGMKGGWFHFSHLESQRAYVVGIEKAYRSDDAGGMWIPCEQVRRELPQSSTSLAIDPRDADTIFLATRGSGVLLSQDGCRSWQPSNEGIGNLFVNTVATDPKSPDILYAGTDGGAYVSLDGGQSWGSIHEGLLGATVVYSIIVDPQSNVYAATPYGIFRLGSK